MLKLLKSQRVHLPLLLEQTITSQLFLNVFLTVHPDVFRGERDSFLVLIKPVSSTAYRLRYLAIVIYLEGHVVIPSPLDDYSRGFGNRLLNRMCLFNEQT